ncbi:MAG: 23S rRNA (uracil(1939)-C(5))-methyltransferase RlmD [Chitinophagaceae bacterium]
MARKRKKVRIIEKIRVEDYAAEGRCLARWEGKVVFIERTVPGDLVDVYLFKNKKDWAEGFPLVFHELSPRRVTPFCSHFGDCGGCQWQTIPYEEQLRFKHRQVVDALERIAKVKLPEISPIIGAREDRYFRNKLEYTFGTYKYIPEGEFQKNKTEHGADEPAGRKPPVPDANGAAGFHAKGLFDKIVDITTCYLQEEPSNKVREAIREYALSNDLSFYDVRHHTGFIRNVQLRVCTTGETMANLIVGENDIPKTEAMLQHLQQAVPSVSTWVYTINQKKNDSLYDLSPVTFSGTGYVTEKLSAGPGEDYLFKIGPKSFFQTNTKQAEQLYRVTRDFAELTGRETVYDLYCGTGSIGIFVSRNAGKIIGVDVIGEAIEDARENARLNGLEKAEFIAGDVIAVCNDDFFAAHGRPDVIITDPPRAGMHEKLVRKILEMAAPVVVYVSCNPATQARDLRLLDEKYEVTRVQPVDMFPHTHHIENIVQLKLRNPL